MPLGVEKMSFVPRRTVSGVGDLLDEIAAQLARARATPERQLPDLRVALIGRPNVGKSSLLNRLAGFDRSIVDATPGTTRDPVDVPLDYKASDVLLIDTAGIRRRPRVEGELEHHSVGRAIEVIRRAEVLLLVIDATEGITDQDVRLAQLVESNDRAMVIVCNKWDAAAKQGGKHVPRSFATPPSLSVSRIRGDRVYLGAHRRRRRTISFRRPARPVKHGIRLSRPRC